MYVAGRWGVPWFVNGAAGRHLQQQRLFRVKRGCAAKCMRDTPEGYHSPQRSCNKGLPAI